MDNTFKSPNIISFCTGIRGIERGLERAIGKLNVLVDVEIEAFICENLLQQMEQSLLAPSLIWTDVKTFPSKIFAGKVDGIIGGYPCQPFSNAGLRRGADDPRHLWPYIRKHIDLVRPTWCFFENVGGHLSLGFREVLYSLRSMGYAVEAGIYTAEEAGAPHKRERLFILALDNTRIERLKQEYQISTGRDRPEYAGESLGVAQFDTEMSKLKFSRNTWSRWTRPSNNGEELANSRHTDPSRWFCVEKGHQNMGSREPSSCSGELANSNIQGSQIRRKQTAREEFTTTHRGSEPTRWPARPGESQKSWEKPRTIKSGMGCTVDGYNYREDFLRALGNSVVEQTAEIAFIDLLNKHFKL